MKGCSGHIQKGGNMYLNYGNDQDAEYETIKIILSFVLLVLIIIMIYYFFINK